MSLLTAEDKPPTSQEWLQAELKKLCKGDKFFTPYTSFKAVFDSSGKTLESKIKDIDSDISKLRENLLKITKVSKETSISSLGDIKLFLEGFNNGDNLRQILDDVNQDTLRFEVTGYINKNTY